MAKKKLNPTTLTLPTLLLNFKFFFIDFFKVKKIFLKKGKKN